MPEFLHSVLTSIFLLSLLAATSYGQGPIEVEYGAIRQLQLDYALPQLIEHADRFSPDLFLPDQHIVQAYREHSTSLFILSLVPTPSYSFSDGDRGWRVSLNLSQVISALTRRRESFSRLSDLSERKQHAIHTLHLKLIRLHQGFLSSRREISDLERKIETRKKMLELNGELHRLGRISDAQMLRENQALSDLESDLQSTLDRAVQDLTELYFYAGFRITFAPPPALPGKVLSNTPP